MPAIPVEFILFTLTLLGIAVVHHRAFEVAVAGVSTIALYKLVFGTFHAGTGLSGLLGHLGDEWVILANLGLLLPGFALLSRHFEESQVPKILPRFLPSDWKGGFLLLSIVFVLSSFLDNIAAALIGGTMARSLFRSVHIGYIAAIVAASNGGGAGSVVGDTTTTMMWIDRVPPSQVLHAYVAAVTALVVCGIPASLQQLRHAPMLRAALSSIAVDWPRLVIVGSILLAAIAANVIVNTRVPGYANLFPFLGATVWVALLVTALVRRPDWHLVPEAARSTAFLLCLVLAASLMPVEHLPAPSWQTTFGLGFVSAVFDNIPLTALALQQGGYDWGMLAYAVGYGGSMIWFGSSAGVAITSLFPEARGVGPWVGKGWHVTVAYVVGFFVLLAALGWNPTAKGVAP